MRYAFIYGTTLLVYCVIDMAWLALMYSKLYKPALAGLMLAKPKITPAIIFYLIYPIGILVFAILPALDSASASSAFLLGALLGGLAYATYSLTNQATLQSWKLQLTVSDICWGAFVTGASAALSYYATGLIGPSLGLH